MAEFCLDCWNKIMGTEDTPKKYIISKDLELCEECGEWKRVIVAVKGRYIVKDLFEEWVSALRERRKLQRQDKE